MTGAPPAPTESCNRAPLDPYYMMGTHEKRRKRFLKRYVVLYPATLLIFVPIDFLLHKTACPAQGRALVRRQLDVSGGYFGCGTIRI
jgi:hypothetical protein